MKILQEQDIWQTNERKKLSLCVLCTLFGDVFSNRVPFFIGYESIHTAENYIPSCPKTAGNPHTSRIRWETKFLPLIDPLKTQVPCRFLQH